jgi:anti-anti-sigma factor
MLDFEARSTIREAVARLLDEETGDRNVVLDLRGVSMIDSAGLGGLVTALRLCDDHAPAWELMPSAPVRRILALVGLGRIRSGESGGWLAGGGYGSDS